MANNDLNKRFFTNTYITGSGRRNYLRIDNLEDPLFTSFTFDIDYVTSPLFYTINYSDYGYPNIEGIASGIESALEAMYGEYMGGKDSGYDILPVLSASILDGNKLGFGLQQNVYMDMPLYGATEYIYMVDKRNGGSDQNDARFDSNQFVDSGGNPNVLNGFKLGDSVKGIVNDSDKAWAERQQQQNLQQMSACDDIMNDQNVKKEHEENEREMNLLMNQCNNVKVRVDGVSGEFSETEIQKKIDELKSATDAFEQFKREIITWANDMLSGYQNRGTAIYMENKCMQKIVSYGESLNEGTKDKCSVELEKLYGKNFSDEKLFTGKNSYVVKFKNLFNELETYKGKGYWDAQEDDGKSFLLDLTRGDDAAGIRPSKIIDRFGDKLSKFGLLNKDNTMKGAVRAHFLKTPPDWATMLYSKSTYFTKNPNDYKNIDQMIKAMMSYQCDIDLSFSEEFVSELMKTNEEQLAKYESALDDIRTELYGFENGVPCDKSNPSPESTYGRYLEAKDKCENDEYSQAEKARSLAASGASEMTNMINRDEYMQGIMDENYNESLKTDSQPLEINRNESIVAAQTVLDMLGFITGMKKMTNDYPYIIQSITGLDTAYNKNYGIKDPYLGSGDDKITLTCLESLDLRVSSMFNRYFNAVYDRQYRRERVPVNLRRFNCSIYVHDVRNFVSKVRSDVTYNRILELTDMYHSVIEFRFYDCEIIPEETGNIFDNISNEAPSEMKKTNFTFTYGNCVVNFVPPSEVAAH